MSDILGMISSPGDLRLLTIEELFKLKKEIINKIISTVAKTGGHLASSLGVVELTIALHHVFDTPADKIIWDVGHQTYAHKLLTGRSAKFGSLRRYQGLSGFPKKEESIYDAFNTGHSSTSISASLGIAKARDLRKEQYKVVSVIGDGALTGGMAFEALNQAGDLDTDLIVILNDNKMSISPNIGALNTYLRKMVTDPNYLERKKTAKNFLNELPLIGDRAGLLAANMEETLRAFSSTPGLLFKELGFNYFGPIDGHDLKELITSLQNIKKLKGPRILHVITKKGHGYKYAERDKVKFHGISPFDPANGKKIVCNSTTTFTQAFSKCLMKLAEKDKSIVAITAAMSSGTGLESFQKAFPQRFFDVGIAEQHAVTFAAGLASQGMKPVVAVYSTFLQRAYDQIVHDVALQNLPVTFALDRAGLVGEDGPTHHGAFDLSYLRHIPNMVVMAPKDENELGHMLRTAIEHGGPAALRYPRGCGIGVAIQNPYKKIPIGSYEVLKSGRDTAIFAVGSMVEEALQASRSLKSAAVINARFIKPLDEKTIIRFAKKAKKVITVEENALQAGFGSALLEFLEKKKIRTEVKRIGIPDRFVPHGPVSLLRKKLGLSKENIIRQAS